MIMLMICAISATKGCLVWWLIPRADRVLLLDA